APQTALAQELVAATPPEHPPNGADGKADHGESTEGRSALGPRTTCPNYTKTPRCTQPGGVSLLRSGIRTRAGRRQHFPLFGLSIGAVAAGVRNGEGKRQQAATTPSPTAGTVPCRRESLGGLRRADPGATPAAAVS